MQLILGRRFVLPLAALVVLASVAVGCSLSPRRYVHDYRGGDVVAFANGLEVVVPDRWNGSIDMTPEAPGDTTDPAYGALGLSGPAGEQLDVSAESTLVATRTLALWRGWAKEDAAGSSVTTMLAGFKIDAVVFPDSAGSTRQTLEVVVWGERQPLAVQLTGSHQLDTAVASREPLGSIVSDLLERCALRRTTD